ncbi:MAG: hypothetical protein WC712_01180 [Candidatus Brocadiia bacterium]
MRTVAGIALALAAVVMVLCTQGCKDPGEVFKRRPITPAQNTPEWRYYHNYRMYDHESGVLEEALTRGKLQVKSSWPRLREYLTSMRDNLPADKSFDFTGICNDYDTVMSTYLEKSGNGRVALQKIETLRHRIEFAYTPEKVYPNWKPETKKK